MAAVDPALRATDVPIALAQGNTSRAWVSLRLVLAGLCLFAMVAGYVTHERPATLQDLYASVAAGEVPRSMAASRVAVSVSVPGLPVIPCRGSPSHRNQNGGVVRGIDRLA